ncbi:MULTISPECIES: YdcF family protein [unclassified Bacillus (in: firmicutes)]|uniref:YdcF family protein n=1 Tax=unclassified Bacillus (in: firmicutes) TaxID=185979 RepID=UPI000BF003FE|nr:MULTISPECIES: YdcF family protein [unclassified Bacillus (in: firmicutes)]PEJ57903.1 cytoplasmic protein [Bacillus sp. AFS002410]PEL12526.1 cytoplasmic protein [Bacillus sp. AFS017336]
MGFFKLITYTILIGILGYLFCIVFIGANSFLQYKHKVPKDAEYVIVLGAGLKKDKPTRALRYRIETAAKYAKENTSAKIIVSGGKGKDELISEAECMKGELIKLGIGEDRIIKEDLSTNTYENMKYSKKLINNANAKGIVVSNDYHLFRSLKLAKKQGLNVIGLPAKTPRVIIPTAYFRECLSILKAIYYKQI